MPAPFVSHPWSRDHLETANKIFFQERFHRKTESWKVYENFAYYVNGSATSVVLDMVVS